jgi:3-methyl-2-oxobutanoate hydroxymethyltransferase
VEDLMSAQAEPGNKSALSLKIFGRRKRRGEKLVVLTAYDLTSAQIASNGGVDAILVGDSVGMVVMGHENTLSVTVDDMIHHCRSVAQAKPQVPIIADMPYGSFHISPEQTVANALRLIKEGGAQAVKLEGGRNREAAIKALIAAEIPVMGHLGLTPQSVHKFGGYKVQGRGAAAAEKILEDGMLLAAWGCFAIVLECVPANLAYKLSQAIAVPTIGIGAGGQCDGQVLVFHDMLGLHGGHLPRFVKQYAQLAETATAAVAKFAEEVRRGEFPELEHEYGELTESSGRAKKKESAPDTIEKGKE